MLRHPIRYQAAVVRDDHALLLRVRDRPSGETFWVLPGGGREGDETPEASVRREVLEETGLDVAVLGLLFATPDMPGGIYEALHTYHCRVVGGVAAPGIEPEVDDASYRTIREVAWFDLRDPASWGMSVAEDPITFPLLQQVRAALGYAPPSR